MYKNAMQGMVSVVGILFLGYLPEIRWCDGGTGCEAEHYLYFM